MFDAAFTRRLFLQRGCALASMAATVPCFIERSALGILGDPLLSSQPGVPDERILVIIQLGGGNDGLNTVIPFGDDEYYRARPQIGVRAPGAAALNSQPAALTLDANRGIGLHPNLEGLKTLYDEGVVSIVQGVGYPNPNRPARRQGIGMDRPLVRQPLHRNSAARGRDCPWTHRTARAGGRHSEGDRI